MSIESGVELLPRPRLPAHLHHPLDVARAGPEGEAVEHVERPLAFGQRRAEVGLRRRRVCGAAEPDQAQHHAKTKNEE
ncbi:MAG: hypothetical protein AAF333_17745 [Planctomycetota bacterium]